MARKVVQVWLILALVMTLRQHVMTPIQLFDPESSTYTYILFDESSRDAVIIDPVDVQIERDLATLRQYGLRLIWALETHVHADHITSAEQLVELTPAKTAVELNHGDILRFGNEQLKAIDTPGHTTGSMSYLWRDHVFTGDSLLIDGCGRPDFQSGSTEALYHSLTQVLFALPDATKVWPARDYQGRSHSTIGAEKRSNSRVAGKSLAEFTAGLATLHLPAPARLDEALAANFHSSLRHDAGGDPIMTVRPADGYAGDISPQLACQWWQADEAMLIDVRSDAERAWVGFVPGAAPVTWKLWPGMTVNPNFDAELMGAGPAGKKLVLLCRSGVRSIAAAKRATQLGLEAYNILEGFEGDPDDHAHRGMKNGWRFRGLPWRQG